MHEFLDIQVATVIIHPGHCISNMLYLWTE